jgi:3-deoxy-7-phosphoheptulonate synthase/chorismate mutase
MGSRTQASSGAGVEGLRLLRARIDAVNRRLLAVLEERATLVLEIAEHKAAQGVPSFDRRREEQMLRQVSLEARGPLSPEELREVFSAVFRASLALQERVRATHERDRVPSRSVP